MKKILPARILKLIAVMLGFASVASAQSIPTISPWVYFGGGVKATRTVATSTIVLVGGNATTTASIFQVKGNATITSLATTTPSTCVTADSAGTLGLTTCGSGGGTGTVTSVSVVNANGVSGTVANATTTPAITLTLGDITPSSVETGAIRTTGSGVSMFNNGGLGFYSDAGFTQTGAITVFPAGDYSMAGPDGSTSGILSFANIASSDKTFTFPNQSGTVALTSGVISSLNAQTGATQTFATSSTGSGFNLTSAGNVHTLRIGTATSTATGLLTGADWSIFNNKLSTALVTLNGQTGATQTFATSSAGSGFNLTSSGNTHTLAIGTATSTATGLLTGSDWSAFNGKLSAAITSLNGLTGATQTFATSTSSGVFTVASGGSTHTITIPSNVGFFTNDSGYLPASGNLATLTSTSTARTNLGLAIGTNVQAWDADLDTIAALTKTKGNLIAANGSNWAALAVGTNGKVLTASSTATNGVSWETSSAAPGGSDTQIQFNDSSAFGGDSALTFSKTGTGLLTVGDVDAAGSNGFVMAGGKYIQFNDDPTENFTQIAVQQAQTVDGNGTELDIYSGEGNGNGDGGFLYFGAGGNGGSAQGAFADFPGGKTSGAPGDTRIKGAGSDNSTGGGVSIIGSQATASGQNGGAVTLQGGAGAGTSTGGGISLFPGNGTTRGTVKLKDASSTLNAIFDTSGIASSDKTFAFPNLSGTLALTNGVLSSLNGLTGSTQTFAVGTAGSDINISSTSTIHTFNFPETSSSTRGVVASSTYASIAKKRFDFFLENPTATEDDALMTFDATSTILKVYAVNKTNSDTVTFNLFHAASRSQSTSTSQAVFSAYQTNTATTTPTSYTSFASSTVNTGSVLRFNTTAASSTQFMFTVYYREGT